MNDTQNAEQPTRIPAQRSWLRVARYLSPWAALRAATRHGGRGYLPLLVAFNCVRISLCAAWTAVVGTVILAVIWPRYWYGLLRARLGRSDVLDRILEANARFAGWVAQELWTRVLLAITGVRLRARELFPIDWSRPHVVCANHASLFDIFALIRIVPPTSPGRSTCCARRRAR